MGAVAAAGAAGTIAAAGVAAAAASAGLVTAPAPAPVRSTVAMQASLSNASSSSTSASVPSASMSVYGHHHRHLHHHQQQQQRHQQQQGHEQHRPHSQNRNRHESANDGRHHAWIQATFGATNNGNGAHRHRTCALQGPLPRHLLHCRAHHHFAGVYFHDLPHAHIHRLSCPHGPLHQPYNAQRQFHSCFLGNLSAKLHLHWRGDQQQEQQQRWRRHLHPQALGRQWEGESGGSLEEMQMQDHSQRQTADPLLFAAAALPPPAAARAAPAASGAASPAAVERRSRASVSASAQRCRYGSRCIVVQRSPLHAGSMSRQRSCSFGAVCGCGGRSNGIVASSSGGVGVGGHGRGSTVLVRAAAADAPSAAGADAGSQQQEDTGKVVVAQLQVRQGQIEGSSSTNYSSSSNETSAAADTKQGPPAAFPEKLGAAAVTAAGASDGSAAAAGTKQGVEAEADAEAEAEAQLQMQAELERLALQQAENDVAREAAWRVRLRRATGRLQGSPWDPLPGGDMEYSELRALLRQGVVEHVEYGDYGKHVAVILPHSLEDVERSAAAAGAAAEADASSTAGSGKQGERQEQAGQEEDEVVWLRHVVRRMPADAHNALWAELRQQNIVTLPPHSSLPQTTPLAAGGGALLSPQQQQASTSILVAAAAPGQQMAHVHIHNHEAAVVPQVAATLGLAAAWVVRLAVAVVVFRWLDAKLLPIYRPTKLDDRPRSTSRKLTAALDPALGTMGQSRARYISAEEKTGVTFDDFAGQDYVKRELQEVVRILREAKEFEQLGVYCPKGVLLFGPPGTGKTLLAKAIAGEAGVPFFSVSGSEFVEMFAGVAASRVKDLFFRARQFAPSIIFIDEIDAIGAKRGSSEGDEGGSIEREQGLIQILTELDGFQEQAAKVLVIGATNRLDMLDPALLRKGRFDKVVRVGLPTEEGRYNILQVHARNKHFESNEERDKLLKEVAALTPEFSGAELMNVLNEAAILAVREDRDEIRREELLRALDRQAGEFKTGEEDVVHAPEVRLRTAYREAAIAVLACALPDPAHPILKTTLEDYDPLPNTEYVKVRHRTFTQKQHMVNAIVRAFAPPVAERLVFGAANASWQAGVAYREAVQLADYVILRSGMSALGGVTYETQKDLMKHLTPKVVALRDEYLRYGMQACDAIVREYRSALDTIAERLLEENVVDGAEIQRIFNAAPRFPQPPVRPIDEYGALVHTGRWGIYGNSLPGRATFSPGNCGYVTFAAPRPRQVQRIADMTWREIDRMWEERKKELEEMDAEEEESGEVQFLQPSLLL